MNIGDKIRINLKDAVKDDYYKDIYYNSEMFKYDGREGKIVEITSYNGSGTKKGFKLDIDKEEWCWGEAVLEKVDEKETKKKNKKESDSDVKEVVEVFKEEMNLRNKSIDELTNNLKDLCKNINKRTLYDDSMQDLVVEKVKKISVEDLVGEIEKRIEEHIKKTYGALPRKTIEINNGECIREVKGMFHNKFEEILKIVKAGVPVMLVGGAGAGKNHTLEQVAEALGLDFYFSNAVTQEFALKGFIDAGGTYHETQFYKAYKDGGLFFLDEADGSVAEALLTLNSAIANGYYDFPVGRVNAHKDFRIVCAGNTYGTGADMIYVGRNVLDGATLDRFAVVEFDYDKDIEEQLAYDKELYKFIVALRDAVNKNQLRYIVSMRATINSTKLLDMGLSKKEVLITSIIKSMKTDDLNIIINHINCKNEWFDLLKEVVDERN